MGCLAEELCRLNRPYSKRPILSFLGSAGLAVFFEGGPPLDRIWPSGRSPPAGSRLANLVNLAIARRTDSHATKHHGARPLFTWGLSASRWAAGLLFSFSSSRFAKCRKYQYSPRHSQKQKHEINCMSYGKQSWYYGKRGWRSRQASGNACGYLMMVVIGLFIIGSCQTSKLKANT